MVVVAEVNSDGHEVKEIEPDMANTITTTGAGMLSAFGVAAKSLAKMSVDPQVVGEDASGVLIQWRAAVVHLLVAFRDHVLPLSQSSANDVEKTIRTYFGPQSTLDEFKQLLPVLKAKLGPRIKSARDAKTKIVLLSSDLTSLSNLINRELASVEDTLEKAMIECGKNEKVAKKAANRVNAAGAATSLGTVVGALAVAKGLLTTGGMIVAIPPLAPVVLGVGLYMASKSTEQSSNFAQEYTDKAENFKAMCGQIYETLGSVKDLDTNCISKLAFCLEKFASFFGYIQSQVEQMSNPECEIGYPDHALDLLFNRLKDQARDVIRACCEFNSCCTKVEIAVQVLDQFKPEDSSEFMAEWIKRANEEIKRRTSV